MLRISRSSVTAFGDWHGDKTFAERAIRSACTGHPCDVLVHVGDFGFGFLDNSEEYLDVIERLCVEFDTMMLVAGGNHENYDWLATVPVDDDGIQWVRPHVGHVTRSTVVEIGGHRWLFLGGAVSINRATIMDSWWPQEEITDDEFAHAAEACNISVMVTHDAPLTDDLARVLVRHWPAPNPEWAPEDTARAHEHRDKMTTVVKKVTPPTLVHGHYHCRYGSWLDNTRVIGLDSNMGTRGSNVARLDAAGSVL